MSDPPGCHCPTQTRLTTRGRSPGRLPGCARGGDGARTPARAIPLSPLAERGWGEARSARCRSSVVEHSLGKGEVVCSIHTGSTSPDTCVSSGISGGPRPRGALRREQTREHEIWSSAAHPVTEPPASAITLMWRAIARGERLSVAGARCDPDFSQCSCGTGETPGGAPYILGQTGPTALRASSLARRKGKSDAPIEYAADLPRASPSLRWGLQVAGRCLPLCLARASAPTTQTSVVTRAVVPRPAEPVPSAASAHRRARTCGAGSKARARSLPAPMAEPAPSAPTAARPRRQPPARRTKEWHEFGEGMRSAPR